VLATYSVCRATEEEPLLESDENDRRWKGGGVDDRPHPHVSEMHPPNFHSWVIVTATEERTSLSSGVLRLLFSIVVILVQVFVLALMIRESDNARCLSNEACPTGTWCGGASASTRVGGAGASGSCFDCYYATVDPAWAESHSPGDLSSAQAHCKKHDRFPTRCEYVYDSHEQATGSTLFIIMFVAALVPLPIINDADEVGTDNKILVHRIQERKTQFNPILTRF